MNTTEFDEIRPYNDEELSGVFEELIADPAFQKVVAGVIPDVPFEMLAQRCVPVERNWNFRKPFATVCYGNLQATVRMVFHWIIRLFRTRAKHTPTSRITVTSFLIPVSYLYC